MKLIFKTVLILVSIVTLNSCSNSDNQIVATSLKEKGGVYTLGYGPKMEFNHVNDSLHILLTPDDFSKILGGPIKQSDLIIKRDKFQIRLFLYENYAKGTARYRVMLRTYANDMKIVDEFVIASTIEEELSDGYLTEGLKAVSKYKDSSEVVMQIDDYGTFKNTAK